MDQKEQITIFHLYRKDGTALFLHPFENLEKLMSVLRRSEIVGKYGREPRVESLTLFRNDLYRMIEEAVKGWVAETRFLPRFLISAAVFLLAYLFLSFVIRDPIPIIDEVLIGLGLALVTYFVINRRDQRSNIAMKKRVELRAAVDRILFQQDLFVGEVEEALQRNEASRREDILQDMLSGMDKQISIANGVDAQQLITYLEKRFNSREYRKQEKLLTRAKGTRGANREVELLSRWSESKKIDLSLFDVYRRIKKSYRKVK